MTILRNYQVGELLGILSTGPKIVYNSGTLKGMQMVL
jgi:hypothetical protein